MEVPNQSIVIIGAGFAGIGLAIRLKKAGIEDFTILERAPRVGGVWRDNHYPGVACDVESHLYSFSFEPNPEWSRMFAPQREILAYLERCADRYGLRSHIRLETEVTGARFDDASALWTVDTSDGRSLRARVVVSCAGHALSKPVLPDIPGLEAFEGELFHSARWRDDESLEGKTVAVIGTGASAIQIVPNIVDRVGRMHVFQRTAPWITPKPDRAVTPVERAVFRAAPAVQKLTRVGIYWLRELLGAGFVWDARLLRPLEHLARRHLARSVRDPALRAKLTPTYRLGCKRVLPSNDFYPAIVRPHVELVTARIREIRPHAIVTEDGVERRVDVIVCATGFEAAEATAPFMVKGADGRDLMDAWRDGLEAYLGTSIAGFPNLFLVVGPNTGLGHSSMIFMMESQFAYVVSCVKQMRANAWASVDVRPSVQMTYNAEIQRRLATTVWNSGCVSWYRTRAGRNTTLWPGFTFEFRLRTRAFDPSRYCIEPMRGAM